MNDRIDTTIATGDAPDADDRIDALARSAGSALRRPASADQLVRIHRAKRNQQIARATGGAAAVLALVGGAVLLMNRGTEERLVPATVPSTVPATTPSTSPVTSPSTAVVTVPSTAPVSVPTTATVPATDPPVSTSPPVNTATGEPPSVIYVGTQTTGEDDQQLVDFATGNAVGTEPMTADISLTANAPQPEPRTSSAVNGIEYAADVENFDGCGQNPVTVGTDAGVASALPERASLMRVSDDGRYVLTMSAPDCPRPQILEPGDAIGLVAVQHVQEIRVFDADDPSLPGRLLGSVRMLGNEGTQAQFSADGRFVVLRPVTIEGESSASIVGYDLETGSAIVLDDGDCLLPASQARGSSFFVGEQSVVALTEKCDDGWHVEIASLYAPEATADWIVPGISPDEVLAVDVEVWEQSLTTVDDATFTVSATDGIDPSVSRLFLRRTGGELEQLPFEGTIASFFPIWDTVGS